MLIIGLNFFHDQMDPTPRTQFCYFYIEQQFSLGAAYRSVMVLSLYLSQAHVQLNQAP